MLKIDVRRARVSFPEVFELGDEVPHDPEEPFDDWPV
jgi:hypothetical protein